MLIYGIEPDAAFELLRWRSQQTNVKLRALAAQLTLDLMALAGDTQLPSRATFDHLLMTVHERIADH